MQEEIRLDFKDFFHILQKRIKLIIAITLISTLAAGIISFYVMPPIYEASLSVFIGKSSDPMSDSIKYDSSDIMMYQKLVKTYAKIAQSNDVGERALYRLYGDYTVKEIQQMVKVTPQADTQIMDIKTENTDPEEAKRIVEAVTEAFIEKSEQIIPNGNVQIIDTAKIPENPIKPRKTMNVAIAFFMGLMVSMGIIFLQEYMDSTIKTEDDIKKYVEIPVLGMIPDHMSE